ncbi:MAG: molybdenum cofactor guanylyltransferase [Lentimicrobium sp.]|nr:molybdenum cofactor guanylyltransferase [Lentimicrobium sp.]
MINKTLITGIVLAGGKSSRMGSDKGLMIFNGKPLVQYSLDLLSLFCENILISSNNPSYKSFGFEVIADEVTGAGPIAGIASCLRHSGTSLNLVLSCDMPLLEPVVIETLLKNAEGNTFVVPIDSSGRAEPLCALYRSESLAYAEKLIQLESYRMTALFDKAPVKYIKPGDYPVRYNESWFANLNTPDDFHTSNSGSS